MAVTFELLEEFDGTRTHTMATPDGDEDTIETGVRNVKVRFTCDQTEVTHERLVNVVFDDEGDYDAEATLSRVEEVARGVENKIACGSLA